MYLWKGNIYIYETLLGFELRLLRWWALPVKSGWKSLDFCTQWRVKELGAKSEFTLSVCFSQRKEAEAEAEVFYGSLFSGGERWRIPSVELIGTLCDLFNKGDEQLRARDWPFSPCNFHTPSEIWTSSSICTMKHTNTNTPGRTHYAICAQQDPDPCTCLASFCEDIHDFLE